MLLPSCRIGRSCWTRKNGARTLTANSLSKSSTVVSSIVAAFETPALATRISKTVADDGADLLGELVRPVRRGEIGGDGVGAAAGLADFSDDGFRLLRAASVMDEHLGAGLGERQCAGAPDAARGAGDESRFS